ncbi:hypothetical protein FRC12_005068 [Ceratobasidium sp. 428]|nr:hypothetical protein FRC12_005068 [Ceratobasidium sp. 428]
MGQSHGYRFGKIILHVFEPNVSLEHLTKVFTPGAVLAYCGWLLIILFADKKSAKAVVAMTKKLEEFFNLMQTYIYKFDHTINTTLGDVESTLQQIAQDFAELWQCGIQISVGLWVFILCVS